MLVTMAFMPFSNWAYSVSGKAHEMRRWHTYQIIRGVLLTMHDVVPMLAVDRVPVGAGMLISQNLFLLGEGLDLDLDLLGCSLCLVALGTQFDMYWNCL